MLNTFILSSERIRFKFEKRIYYIPHNILSYNDNDFTMYKLETKLKINNKQNNNIMSGAFSIVLEYRDMKNNPIIVKIMNGNVNNVKKEILFYDLASKKDNYDEHICKYYGNYSEYYKRNYYNYIFLEKLTIDLYDFIYENNYNYGLYYCLLVLKLIANHLIFIHDLGFIYNDLKLENLMVDKKGRIKLVDFNCISSKKYRMIGSGTLEYMSSETISNLKNQTEILDPRSDSWSYGLLLYELLTHKQSPFHHNTKNGIIKKIIKNQLNNQEKAYKLLINNCIILTKKNKKKIKLLGNIFCNCLKSNYLDRPCMDIIHNLLNKI